jgi:hypothetical protein
MGKKLFGAVTKKFGNCHKKMLTNLFLQWSREFQYWDTAFNAHRRCLVGKLDFNIRMLVFAWFKSDPQKSYSVWQ